MNRDAFQTNFQYRILEGLKPRATGAAITGKIAINRKVYEWLMDLGLTGRYNSAVELTTLFILSRTEENADVYGAVPERLQVKIMNQKKTTANGESFSSGVYTFSYRFRRYFDRH